MKLRPLLPVAFFGLALFACGGEQTAPVAPLPPAPPAPSTPPVPPPPVATASAPDAARAEPPSTEATPAAPPSTPDNEVTMSMLHALHAEKGNLFYSGASLRGALGMTALGAKGATLDEMAKALSIDPDPAKNVASAKAEMEAWKSAAGKTELVIANRLWVEKAYPLEKAFVAETQQGYGATAVPTDFSKAAEPSRVKINGWVAETTKGKIKDLLPPGSVVSLTRLVLTNAIYFKGNWAQPFDKKLTKDESFHADGGDVTAPMMHKEAEIGYVENADAKIGVLPYKNSDLAMVVMLPQRGLGALEANLAAGQLDAWAKSATKAKVNVTMPRFTFSWGRSVKPELQALGIQTAFSEKADFTGIAAPKSGPPLSVSDVFHKAFVLVDETGTEAAAATGGAMVMAALIRTVELKLDRPFLFFVRNQKTGDVLFAGRVANPKG